MRGPYLLLDSDALNALARIHLLDRPPRWEDLDDAPWYELMRFVDGHLVISIRPLELPNAMDVLDQ